MINGQNGHPQCNVTITIKMIQITQASLAAVIITAVVSSVEYEVVKPIWKSKSKIFCNTTCGDIWLWWYFDDYWLFDCSGGLILDWERIIYLKPYPASIGCDIMMLVII